MSDSDRRLQVALEIDVHAAGPIYTEAYLTDEGLVLDCYASSEPSTRVIGSGYAFFHEAGLEPPKPLFVEEELTREVEYYRCWPGNGFDTGTWDTDFLEIPANTPDDRLDEAVREAASKLQWRSDPPVFVGFYADAQTNEEDEDE